MDNTSISKETSISIDTIRKILKEYGINNRSYLNRLSESDISFICELYSKDDYQTIFTKYPFLTKNRIYHIASNNNVKKENYFWSAQDIDYLINNYNDTSLNALYTYFNKKYSKKAITQKAIKLNLTQNKVWRSDEIQLLKDNYSIKTKTEICSLFPNRSFAAISQKAESLGIKSKKYLDDRYADDELAFIRDSFGKLTDCEIAKMLNRPVSGISDKRRECGLYYLTKDYSKYNSFIDLFRASIHNWKKESMEKCNYKCVITGNNDFVIHHLYGFNLICMETFEFLLHVEILKSEKISDYTKIEIDSIVKIFQNIHNKYPLGVCVSPKIHKQFHEIYGAGGNTPSQWNEFLKKYA